MIGPATRQAGDDEHEPAVGAITFIYPFALAYGAGEPGSSLRVSQLHGDGERFVIRVRACESPGLGDYLRDDVVEQHAALQMMRTQI